MIHPYLFLIDDQFSWSCFSSLLCGQGWRKNKSSKIKKRDSIEKNPRNRIILCANHRTRRDAFSPPRLFAPLWWLRRRYLSACLAVWLFVSTIILAQVQELVLSIRHCILCASFGVSWPVQFVRTGSHADDGRHRKQHLSLSFCLRPVCQRVEMENSSGERLE